MNERYRTLYNAVVINCTEVFKREWELRDVRYSTMWSGLLHDAVSHGRYSLVKFMLENGADPNTQANAWRSTPLTFGRSVHYTIRTQIHLLLLRYGGNPCLRDRDGNDAFERHDYYYGYMEFYLLAELVCGEADNLPLDLWRDVKPFIYKYIK